MLSKPILSASILNANFSCLADQIKTVEQTNKVDHLHLDVMDGNFVPNLSFGVPVIKDLRSCSKLFFDVHLMVENPEHYFEGLKESKVDGVTFHIESVEDGLKVVKQLKGLGFRAGVTLKPATPVEILKPLLAEVDLVLVMTVEPGFGGQSLMVKMLEKVKYLREHQTNSLDIQVDGGWKANNVHLAVEAGANDIVFGSSLFGQPDLTKAVDILDQSLHDFCQAK